MKKKAKVEAKVVTKVDRTEKRVIKFICPVRGEVEQEVEVKILELGGVAPIQTVR